MLNPLGTPGEKPEVEDFAGAKEEATDKLNPLGPLQNTIEQVEQSNVMDPLGGTAPLYVQYGDNEDLVEVKVIDGDTVSINGVSYRDFGGSAYEDVKLIGDSGAISFGEAGGQQQTQLLIKAIKSGRIKIKPVGEQDTYGRQGAEFVFSDTGQRWGDWLISERYNDLSIDSVKYADAGDKQKKSRDLTATNAMRSGEALRDTINFFNDDLSAEEKTREVIQVLQAQNWQPLSMASNIEEYNKAEFFRTHQGIKALQDTLDSFEQEYQANPTPELEAEIQKTKEAIQYWANAPQKFYGYNQAPYVGNKGVLGQWSDSLDATGWGFQNIAGGLMHWAGDTTGWESLAETGEAWSDEASAEIADINQTRVDWGDDITFGNFMMFASNLAIEYVPQMIPLIAAGFIGGVPLAFGASFLYAVGEVHNALSEGGEDPNPLLSAGIALPIAALDAIIPGKITTKDGLNAFTKEGKDAIINLVAKEKDISLEAAENLVKKRFQDVMQETTIDMSNFIADNMLAKKTLRDWAWDTAETAILEGATEGFQEGFQEAMTATFNDSKEFSWDNVLEAAKAGAVIGSIVGTPLGAYSAARENAQYNEIIYEYGETQAEMDRIDQYYDRLMTLYGKDVSLEKVVKHWNEKNVDGFDPTKHSIEALSGGESYGHWENFKDNWNKPWRLMTTNFRGRITGSEDIMPSGRIDDDMLVMGALLNNVKGLGGNQNVGAHQARLRNKYLFLQTSSRELAELAGVNTEQELMALRSQEWNTLTENQQAAVSKMRADEQAMMEEVVKDMKKFGIRLTEEQEAAYLDNYLEKLRFIDPSKIDADFVDMIAEKIEGHKGKARKSKVQAALEKRGINKGRDISKEAREEAIAFVEEYKANPNNPEHLNFLETMGAFNSTQFGKYQNHNPRANVIQFAGNTSQRIATARFGQNDEILAKLLYSMKKRGYSDKYIKNKAQMIRAYREMVQGNYKRVENTIAKNVQGSILLTAQATMMDSNLFANAVDLAYNAMRLDDKELGKYLASYSKNMAQSVYSDLTLAADKVTPKSLQLAKHKWEIGNEEFQRLAAAGQISDVDEIAMMEGANTASDSIFGRTSQVLYKLNLVASHTDASRAAITLPGLNQVIRLLTVFEKHGTNTKAGRQAQRRLMNYNVNIDKMLKLMNNPILRQIIEDPKTRYDFNKFNEVLKENGIEADADLDALDVNINIGQDKYAFFKELQEEYNIMTANFVDEFAARPEAGTTSLSLEDEHLSMFTQFKRFIWHFTTNQVPTLWNIYLKRGSPTMKFNTFRNIAITVLIAFYAQALKDLMKYGGTPDWIEDDPEDIDEWINSDVYRAASYTGYAGTPEYVFKAFWDYLEDDWTEDPNTMFPEKEWKHFLGQAPALSQIRSGVRAHDKGKMAEWVSARIPFFGDITSSREFIQERL